MCNLKTIIVFFFTALTVCAQEEPTIQPDSMRVKTGCSDPPLPKPPPPPNYRPKPNIVQGPVIKFPDVQSVFPGAREDYQKYLDDNLQYPKSSIDLREEGKVYISFVVEIDGSITQVKIERGVSSSLDAEAARLVRNMPKWKPGELAGKKVRTFRQMPIVFELPEEN